MTCKILVLAANPQDTAQLLLNREVREIDDALERGKCREQFSLRRKDAVRIDDLQSSLQKESARIVHFCGHGMGSQGLVLETSSGQQQLLDTQAIALFAQILLNSIRNFKGFDKLRSREPRLHRDRKVSYLYTIAEYLALQDR